MQGQDGAKVPQGPRVVVSQSRENVEVWVEGERFAHYRYNTADPELPRPYFHPIAGPCGVPVSQDGEFPGTRKGHIWHTGLVIAHQKFTDGNNWQTGSPQFSRMRHQGFEATSDLSQSCSDSPMGWLFEDRIDPNCLGTFTPKKRRHGPFAHETKSKNPANINIDSNRGRSNSQWSGAEKLASITQNNVRERPIRVSVIAHTYPRLKPPEFSSDIILNQSRLAEDFPNL